MKSDYKTLIIRLSSFGDIFHALSVPATLKSHAEGEVHWLVRSDFAELLQNHPSIDQVWSFDKKLGLVGWLKLVSQLRRQGYTHIYDAHNNLRSHILGAYFRMTFWQGSLLRRSKERLRRLLLFRLGKNFFPAPFRSRDSFIIPLAAWGVPPHETRQPQLHFSQEVMTTAKKATTRFDSFIALAPSAAWRMKRWPIEHWKTLIQSLPGENFVILGGPEDTFCQSIADTAPHRCLNLTGKLRLLESCAVLTKAKITISADTGLMHAADILNVPVTALIGPTAFGYPSSPQARVLQTRLSCRPCSKDGRGKCRRQIYQQCMVDITPEQVAAVIVEL